MRVGTSLALTAIACIATAMISLPQAVVAQTDSQAWPQRNVRFIVPFGPGAASDTAARLLAERLQKVWGRPVIVENKAGGDGLVPIGAFVSAKDDHTLLLTPSTLFLVHPYTQDNLPYDADRDFQPIALISNSSIAVGVTASLPVTTLKEFVDYARREAGKVNYGVSGGFLEFVWDGFRREYSVPMVKVPFRDILQAPVELAEGRLDVLFTSLPTHRPMVLGGKTKLLAIADPQRSEFAPDAPSVVEAGFPGAPGAIDECADRPWSHAARIAPANRQGGLGRLEGEGHHRQAAHQRPASDRRGAGGAVSHAGKATRSGRAHRASAGRGAEEVSVHRQSLMRDRARIPPA